MAAIRPVTRPLDRSLLRPDVDHGLDTRLRPRHKSDRQGWQPQITNQLLTLQRVGRLRRRERKVGRLS